jgi:hypothetical protein
VLDCWFESGSMPYASKHYPFELERMSEDISEECQKMGGIERISNDEKLNEKTGKII